MGTYFATYYMESLYGPGYILTAIIYAIGCAALLRNGHTRKDIVRVILDAALLWAAGVVFDSIVHGLGFDTYMEDARMLFQLVLYAALLKSCPKMMAVLRGSMYFACMNLILPVSEPMGDLFKAVFPSFHYADTLTPIIVGASCAFTVWFAHRFSPKNLLHLPWLSAITMAIVSAMGWTLWRLSRYTQPGRLYSLVVAAAFYALVYLFYYMLCLISLESENNERLKAMEQKMAMDHELIETSRANYEEMHEIRHETKNHLIYLKSLAYHGEWDRLWEYLNQLSTRTDEMFTFIECGNDVVNAVMNHAVSQAKHLGVHFETQLAVPEHLSYDETDFLSLVANLADNAIEAASQAEEKTVRFEIFPQKDYLFLRVTNTMNCAVSEKKRLSLQTTKKDKAHHGYGTGIISAIAKKYGGSARFYIEEGLFHAVVMLELKEQDKEGDVR